MSTSIDSSMLPDVRLLEKLANEYFAADGHVYPSEAKNPVHTSAAGVSSQDHTGVNLNRPQTSLQDPHAGDTRPVPSSEAGSGISPGAGGQANRFNASNPQSTLPDTKTTTHGVVPGSVAGSGVSPSVVDHGKTFNIHDPQTSHRDTHLNQPGVVPSSLAGSGISPSVNLFQPQAGLNHYGRYSDQSVSPFSPPSLTPPSLPGLGISPTALPTSTGISADYNKLALPFSQETTFENDLGKALNDLYRDRGDAVNSLPGYDQIPTYPSFYFVSSPRELSLPAQNTPASAHYLSLKQQHGLASPGFDVNLVKRDFPILNEQVNGKQIVWLDNAATTHKPKQVIDRISYFYQHENSNIHRAAHELAARATDAYEEARKKVQMFLHASSPNEIVFVRGATEAINLVAKSWGEQFLRTGDEIIVSHLEHHANIVPWQQLAKRKGLHLRVIPVDDSGQVIMEEYAKLLGPRTKLVSVTQVSNALGTITPVKQITDMAHYAGAKVLIDGAQSVSHMPVDVQNLDCDWFVFSGHKVFGPTGIGVVYGKEALLNETEPWQGGGNMIADVTFEHTEFQNAPSRFEAGTGNIADAVGLGAALDYVMRLGMETIHHYEHYLLQYATTLIKDVPGLKLIGTAHEKASVLSFVLKGYKTEEVGAALNKEGIAVRSGHHCAQPILRRFGLEATVRPSLAFYNTCSDVDRLVTTLHSLTRR